MRQVGGCVHRVIAWLKKAFLSRQSVCPDLACMTEMILRVLLPNSPDLDQSAPCLLLGALLHSTHRGQQVLTAIVVSVKPFELLPPLSQVKQQLANSRVSLPTASAQAKLAVLGAWQLGLHQSATPGKQHPPGSEDHVWLVLQGKQCLQQALGHTSWHGHTWTGPTCNLQQSSLPPGTDLVQVTATIRLERGTRM